jgi:hypothetical protein
VNRFRGWRAVALLLAATGVVTACSGSGASSPTTPTTSPTSSLSTATTEPSTTTTESTAARTTHGPTTVAPTTTIDRVAATKAAVAAAVVQSRQDYLYAVKNYDAPDALKVLARTTARNSPSWTLTVSNMEKLRSNGWLVRPDPVVKSVTKVEGQVELLDGPPSTRAQVVVCTISSGIVYKPAAGPGGADVIVNDDVVARRNRISMVLEGGAWKVFKGVELGSWGGATSCAST